MHETDQLNPIIADKKILIFIGIGALCAGILIGFKLAGGEKVELLEPPIQIIHETQIIQEVETEAENDSRIKSANR